MVAERVRDLQEVQCAARKLGWRALLEVVAHVYGVTPEALQSRERGTAATEGRQMFYYVLYTYLYWKNEAIARVSERDNSSITHGLQQARRRLERSEVEYALRCIEDEIVTRARLEAASVSAGRRGL